MPITKLTIDGKRFVLLPEADFQQLKRPTPKPHRNGTKPTTRKLTAQDLRDIAAAKRALAEPKRIPLSELKRQLGL